MDYAAGLPRSIPLKDSKTTDIMSIADSVADCLDAFKGLSAVLGDAITTSEIQFATRLTDEFQRFKIWTSNVGAHQRGRSSLEYKLRDASHLQTQVIRFLAHIIRALGRASSILSGNSEPWEQLSDSSDDESSDGAREIEADVESTELQQIASYLAEVVNSLLRLTIAIQNPTPHDRFLQSAQFDTSHFQPWDVRHVESKFSSAEPWLVSRLGKAISRRRQYLKYRRQHHERKAMEAIDDGRTVASSIPSAVKQNHDFTAELAASDDEFDESLSQTSFATTNPDGTAFAAPKMPKAALNGRIFECPFCYTLTRVRNRMQWKKHVFLDLQPYVCLRRNCILPDATFKSRRHWAEHEEQHYERTWRCGLCAAELGSVEEVKEHFLDEHGTHTADSEHILSLVSIHSPEKPRLQCPLCLETFDNRRKYYKHVGRHQQQLALFSLAREALEDEDNDQGPRESGKEETDDEEEEEGSDKQRAEESAIEINHNEDQSSWNSLADSDRMIEDAHDELFQEVESRGEFDHFTSWVEDGGDTDVLQGDSFSDSDEESSPLPQNAEKMAGPANFTTETIVRDFAAKEERQEMRGESGDETDVDRFPSPSQYSFTISSPGDDVSGRAVALFDFQSENDNELPLSEGQIVLVSYRHGQGWLVAQDPRNGESGLVPEEYVRMLRDIEGGLLGS